MALHFLQGSLLRAVVRCLSVGLLVASSLQAAAQTGRTALPHVALALPGLDAGELPASAGVPSITVTLRRTAAQQSDLDLYLKDVRTAGSAAYHHWLTPEEFAERFGAPADAVTSVTAWLQSQGLQVSATSAGGMRLSAKGTVAQAEAAFGVRLHRMVLAASESTEVVGTPSVPDALAARVQSVSGLDVSTTDAVAALASAVDANAAGVLTADLAGSNVTAEELQVVLEQAAAQGQTVLLTHAASTQPALALVLGDGAATAAGGTPRPDWQAAKGLPEDGLRVTPDATVGDLAALANGLSSLVLTSGRQGEIAARFYAVAPIEGVFTHADASLAAGTWAAEDGLGTVNVAKLLKALATGSTSPQSSVIALSTHDVTHGQNITLTATITGGSGTPTGTVTFATSQDGTLGSVALSNGVATYTTNTLPGGLHGFYGTYSGDSTYAGSTTNVDTATVQAEAAVITASQYAPSSQYGTTVGINIVARIYVTSSSGVGVPTGTVTVYPYGTAIGSQTFTGTLQAMDAATAVVGISIPATNAGSFTFQANCTTSASFSCYTPVNFAVTVNKGTPAMSVTQTGTSSAAVLTATVAAPTGAGSGTVAPTGSVQFLDNGTAIGSGTLNSSGVATYSGALGSGSTHAVTATYAGDGNYNTASASANAVAKVTPTVVLAQVSTTSLAATVTPPTGTTTIPTGTVRFLLGTTVFATASLNGSGVASYSGTVGSGVVTAVYAGDANFTPATSNAIDTTKMTPTVTLTKVSSSATANTVALSAAVTSTSSTVATGTVQFLDGTALLGTGTLNGSGVATYSGSMTTVAAARIRALATTTVTTTHTLTAVYGGDTNFNAATSNAVTADSTSTAITTSTALTSSSGTTGAYGTSFTFNAVVTPSSYVASGAAPTGTVTLSDASGVVATGVLASGSASLTLSTLSVGTHALTAAYAGDANYAASTSSALSVTITGVTATITAAVSPTGSIPYGYNANVNVTANATAGGVAPGGAVTATVSGGNGTYTGTLAATATGATSSTASIVVPVPTPGTYTVAVACNTNLTCNSATVSLTTVKGATTTTITGVSPSTPQAGSAATLTATVANSGTGTGAYTYSGTVSFYAGSKLLGKGSVSNGVATAPVVFSAAAATSVTAVYSGDTSWSGSTSAVFSVTPTAATPVIAVTANTASGLVGQNITLTATIGASSSSATLVPTGTVTFYDTYQGVTVNLGSVALKSNGLNAAYTALSTTGLRAGAHSIVAAYGGDAAFTSGTSPATAINMGDFALSFSPSSLSLSQGSTGKVTVSVTSVSGYSGAVALSCTPPSNTATACSLDSSTVVTGGSAVLTITTTKSSTAATSNASRVGIASALAGVLALLGLAGRRRRVAALMMVLLLIAVGVCGGCGDQSSSGGGLTTDNGTPLGTLTFTVTGAASADTITTRHASVLSVTVQ